MATPNIPSISSEDMKQLADTTQLKEKQIRDWQRFHFHFNKIFILRGFTFHFSLTVELRIEQNLNFKRFL